MNKGFDCEWCGTYHEFPLYVFAHSRDILIHTCENCGAQHHIVMRTAEMKSPGRKECKKCPSN